MILKSTHRKFIHISGEHHWCIKQAGILLTSLSEFNLPILWCGNKTDACNLSADVTVCLKTRRSDVENLLGSEYSILVINAYDGFNPELFCALSGTIKAPGLILLLTPNLNKWPNYPDPDYLRLCSYPFSQGQIKGRFIQYFIDKLNRAQRQHWLSSTDQNSTEEYDNSLLITSIYNLFKENTLDEGKPLKLTSQQQLIIDRVISLARKNEPGIIVICAKRGRGKSTALGSAVKTLFTQDANRSFQICVTGQSRHNVKQMFNALCKFPGLQTASNSIKYKSCYLKFIPVGEVLSEEFVADLVIVEEAAAIPLTSLYALIKKYPRLVLSTTSDGYEGTGKGFISKLLPLMAEKNLLVDILPLTRPFRWASDDPFELFLSDGLLSSTHNDFPLKSTLMPGLNLMNVSFKKINRDELIHNSGKIDRLYKILSQAHYRTTPDDLRYILDAPDIEIWTAQENEQTCAILVTCNEGEIADDFADSIWLGRRRLKGHLIPQSLSAYCGFKNVIKLSYRRITRIAVLEPYRGKGIGSELVRMIIKDSCNHFDREDFVGVSYGMEQRLFYFWKKLGFFPVRLGFRHNARSGLRSIIMLYRVSERANTISRMLRSNFKLDLDFRLNHSVINGQSKLLQSIAGSQVATKEPEDLSQDKYNIYTFAFGNRQFESCQRTLYKYAHWVITHRTNEVLLSEKQKEILVLKVQQNKNWRYCVELLGYRSRSELVQILRQIYSIIYNAVWGNKS